MVEDGRQALTEGCTTSPPSTLPAQVPFQCKICGRRFPLQKTLNRHSHSVHQSAKFRCSQCALSFNRKDVKDRHEMEQHGTESDTTECMVCHVELRRRALFSHSRSKRHRKAQRQARELLDKQKKAGRDLHASRMLDNEALIDPNLVTSWLFYKLSAYGSSEHTAFRNNAIEPSNEVLELKGQALRSI